MKLFYVAMLLLLTGCAPYQSVTSRCASLYDSYLTVLKLIKINHDIYRGCISSDSNAPSLCNAFWNERNKAILLAEQTQASMRSFYMLHDVCEAEYENALYQWAILLDNMSEGR